MSKVEKCVGELELQRVIGTFTNEAGEEIEYTKYVLNVDGADVDITFDKSVKSLINRFIPFEEVK